MTADASRRAGGSDPLDSKDRDWGARLEQYLAAWRAVFDELVDALHIPALVDLVNRVAVRWLR